MDSVVKTKFLFHRYGPLIIKKQSKVKAMKLESIGRQYAWHERILELEPSQWRTKEQNKQSAMMFTWIFEVLVIC
jgi:hypothetical protein